MMHFKKTFSDQGDLLLRTLPPAIRAISGMVGCDLKVTEGVDPTTTANHELLISLPLSGDINGVLVLAFPAVAGCFLATRMLGDEQSLPWSARALSALQELGNILASGMVTACADHHGLACQLQPPKIISELPLSAQEGVSIKVDSRGSHKDLKLKVFLFVS